MRRLNWVIAALLVPLLVVGGVWLDGTAAVAEDGGELPSFPRDTVIEVNIDIDAADLEDLFANAEQEKEYEAALTWNGETFPHVAIRAKGNSSLSSVARSKSNRYSLKLDLDEYIPGQSLDGIYTINLNNGFSDPSYLRELLSYEAFASLGVPVPATTWVWLTLNGEPHGLYLAVEEIEQPFLSRYFDTATGDLYKPDGEGSDLKWYGDSYADYPGLDYQTKGKNSTHSALLAMLDALNNGGDLEAHLDVDSVLRYLAVSTVLVNLDSYQGQFKHNYYLYEQNGRFTILPWDLNMSFAGFGGSTNLKIDEPTTGALEDHPLIARLLEVEEYRERYHGYIEELITGYLEPDRFAQRVREAAAVIDTYVARDPTSFYTYEQFKAAVSDDADAANTVTLEGQPPGVTEPPTPAVPGDSEQPSPGAAESQVPGVPPQRWTGASEEQPPEVSAERSSGVPPQQWTRAPEGDAGRGEQLPAAPKGQAVRGRDEQAQARGGRRGQGFGFGFGGGTQVSLIAFVRERVANVRQQLNGEIPSAGDGSGTGMGAGPVMGGMGQNRFPGRPGEMPEGMPENMPTPPDFATGEGVLPGAPFGMNEDGGIGGGTGQNPLPGWPGEMPDMPTPPDFPAGEGGLPGGWPPGEAQASGAAQRIGLAAGVLLLLAAGGLIWWRRPRYAE